MKKLILAAASLALITSSAMAQELMKSSSEQTVNAEQEANMAADTEFGLYEVDRTTTSSIDSDAAAPVAGNYDGTVTQRDMHR